MEVIIMSTIKTPMFDINELIVKGKNLAKEYKLPAGTVFVRPLTDLEMNEAEALMFSAIKDEYTRNYMIASVFNDEKSKKDVDPAKINVKEMLMSTTEINIYIGYCAMRDFTTGLTLDLVRQLAGIKDLAEFVRGISGYSSDIEKTVEEFRTDSDGKTA